MSSQSPPSSHYHDAPELLDQGPVKADNNKTSTNPFRKQALATSASAVSFLSHETYSSSPGRQKPVRTVFDDLSTAHSSITSGAARNQQRVTSNPASDAWEELESIPLQELDVLIRRNNAPPPSLLDDLLLAPLPTATIQHRFNKRSNDSDFCLVAEDNKFISQQQVKQNSIKGKLVQTPLKGSSVYHASSGALPSSLPRNKASLNNGSRSRKHKYESYAASLPFPDLGSTPAPPEPSHAKPRQSSKTNRVGSNTASSLPEGSTVGNIYKHYVESENFGDSSDWDDVQSEHDLGNGYPSTQRFGGRDNGLSYDSMSKGQQSALEHRQQCRAERMTSGGQPPISALPSLPKPASHLLPSSSRGVEPSSSYGDTYNLLDLTEQSPFTFSKPVRSNDRNDMRADHDLFNLDDSSRGDTPNHQASNPFRRHNGPQIHVSPADEENDDAYRNFLDNRSEERIPLDREISEALRRASGMSAYSDGSIATSIAENYKRFQSEESISNGLGMLRRQLENSPLEAEADEEPGAAAAREFYDQEAIPSNWIAGRQQNMVRVPIQPQINFHNHSSTYPENKDDDEIGDINDWETVGESGFDLEYKGNTPTMFRQTGSSIADTSDASTASTQIPEITEYGSTERITQHPGHNEYHGDYRQRDLKNTNIPVMIPAYSRSGNKINGYLQDSSRLRSPRNDYYHTLEPIPQPHVNPFKSPPPAIDEKFRTRRPDPSLKNRQQRPSKPEHFPSPVSIKTNSFSDETETEQRRAPLGRLARSVAVKNFSRPSNWMDDYTESPEVNPGGGFLEEIPHVTGSPNRPSSWQLATAFANGETIPGYTLNGVRIVTDSQDRRVATNDFVKQKTYGGKHGPTGNRDRSTRVRGPPVALYRDFSQSNVERSRLDKTNGTRTSTKTYRQSSANGPTNALRPLVLGGPRGRPSTPLDIEVGTDMYPNADMSREPNHFIFESPRGAPKRKTWLQLYTPEQISELRAANMDGAQSLGAGPRAGLLGGRSASHRQGAKSVHLYEEPCLWNGQQRRGFWSYEEPRTRDRLKSERQMKQWSTVTLVLCNFFPPLLLPFSVGKLDWVVTWFSTAKYNQFGNSEKRYAKICMGVWTLIIMITITAVLVWYFAVYGVHHKS